MANHGVLRKNRWALHTKILLDVYSGKKKEKNSRYIYQRPQWRVMAAHLMPRLGMITDTEPRE